MWTAGAFAREYGHGECTWANGDRFEGVWVRGARDGSGVFTRAADGVEEARHYRPVPNSRRADVLGQCAAVRARSGATVDVGDAMAGQTMTPVAL